MRRALTYLRAAALALVTFGAARPAVAEQPWLFVNDVHFNPANHHRTLQTYGDPNAALLASTIAQMRRVAPDPPVIIMAGDFLSHHFTVATAIPTMTGLARQFGAAFPRAQFVIALGNEDSTCGDYAMAPDSPFVRAVAHAWAPLVNRNGAAPDFERTFAHDGFYTARLPIAGLRAVVVDNVYWSTFYHNGCGTHGDPANGTFAELDGALAREGTERRWLIMHIPPGIDAISTLHYTHRLAIVPFLRPRPRETVLGLIGDPARRVELVVTAHVHRFAYRIIARSDGVLVPLLVAPAVSPIFGNSPSFLSADVGADGVIRNLEEHSYVVDRWLDLGDLGSLGVSEFSGQALENLQHRLEREPDLRRTFSRLYNGASIYDPDEINEQNWRSYWCVATEFSATAFRDCIDVGGFSFLTRRGVAVVGAGVAIVAALVGGLIALVIFVVRRRRRPIG